MNVPRYEMLGNKPGNVEKGSCSIFVFLSTTLF